VTDNAPLRDNPGAFLRMGYARALRDEGWTTREIGKRLGLNQSTVSVICRRADRLRRATPSMRTIEETRS
jgi:transcriptional regulator